jgi:NitT/TauT family transport system permease protein
VLLGGLAIWDIGARMSSSFLLPTAGATLGALLELGGAPELWRALWISNQALLIGWPVAIALGVPFGLAIGRWRGVDRWLGVHLDVLVVTPKSAVMPLVVMALGFGLLTRAVVVAVFTFPVIAIAMKDAVRGLDPRLVDMARAFGASERQIWLRIVLPGTRTSLVTALRLGLARAIAGMVSVELLLVAVGIGDLILRYQADFDAASVYAVVLVVAAEAILLLGAAGAVERRFGARRPALVPE